MVLCQLHHQRQLGVHQRRKQHHSIVHVGALYTRHWCDIQGGETERCQGDIRVLEVQCLGRLEKGTS